MRAGSGRARRYRYAVVVGGPLTVTPNTYVTVDLLTPVQPAGTIADSIYQQMTKPTLISIEGHFTAGISTPLGIPSNAPALGAEMAWGIYVDKDISSSSTDLPAYSLGFTTTWMMHKATRLASPALFTQVNADGSVSAVTLGQNDIQYRRWEFRQRKYKRTLDSFNDTLILSVENGSPVSSVSGDITFSFYFRLLLLE